MIISALRSRLFLTRFLEYVSFVETPPAGDEDRLRVGEVKAAFGNDYMYMYVIGTTCS